MKGIRILAFDNDISIPGLRGICEHLGVGLKDGSSALVRYGRPSGGYRARTEVIPELLGDGNFDKILIGDSMGAGVVLANAIPHDLLSKVIVVSSIRCDESYRGLLISRFVLREDLLKLIRELSAGAEKATK